MRVRVLKEGGSRRRAGIAVIAGALIASAAMVGIATVASANFDDGDHVFVVNSLGHAADDELGDGLCDTGDTVDLGDGPVAECTLAAALAEANAFDPVEYPDTDSITIVFDEDLDAGNVLPSHLGTTAGLAYTGTVGTLFGHIGVAGAYYTIDSVLPVTVDFDGGFGIDSQSDAAYAGILVLSDDVVIENFDQIRAGEAAIAIGHPTDGAANPVSNVIVRNGSFSEPFDWMETAVALLDGVSDVNLHNIHTNRMTVFGVLVDQNATVSDVSITGGSTFTDTLVIGGDIYIHTGAEVTDFDVNGATFSTTSSLNNITLANDSVTTNMTVTNSTFSSPNYTSSAIFAHGNATTNNFVVDNNNFETLLFAWEDRAGSGGHDGLTIVNNDIQDAYSHALDFNESSYTNTLVEGNTFLNIRNGAAATIWIGNPAGAGENNVIRNNDFIQEQSFLSSQGAGHANKWAIFNDAVAPGGASDHTGWSITENHVEGYFGSTQAPISNVGIGVTTLWGNTFGEGTRGSFNALQTEAAAAWFVWNEGAHVNNKVQTWRVVGDPVFDDGDETLTVTVGPVAPLLANNDATTPVDIHVYWSATDQAEVYVGAFPAPISAQDSHTFENWVLGEGFVRISIVDEDGNSSQYSGLFDEDGTLDPPVIEEFTDPELSGVGFPGATVEIFDEDGVFLGTGVVASDGTWTVDLEHPDGRELCGFDVYAIQSISNPDLTSEQSEPFSLPPCPAPLEVDDVVEADFTGELSGTGEPGSIVRIVDAAGNILAETVVAGDGTWSVDLGPSICGIEVRAIQLDADSLEVTGETDLFSLPACPGDDTSGPGEDDAVAGVDDDRVSDYIPAMGSPVSDALLALSLMLIAAGVVALWSRRWMVPTPR